jgi:hypothetical protein
LLEVVALIEVLDHPGVSRSRRSQRRRRSGSARSTGTSRLRTLLDAGAAAGDIRPDVEASDVGATLAGILAVAGAPEQREQMGRMFNLLIDGLRSTAGP